MPVTFGDLLAHWRFSKLQKAKQQPEKIGLAKRIGRSPSGRHFLLHLLGDNQAGEDAVFALGQLPVDEVFNPLLSVLQGNLPGASYAAKALVLLGAHHRAAECLIPLLKHPWHATRRKAAARSLSLLDWVPPDNRSACLYYMASGAWHELNRFGKLTIDLTLEFVNDQNRLGSSAVDSEGLASAFVILGSSSDQRSAEVLIQSVECWKRAPILYKAALEALGNRELSPHTRQRICLHGAFIWNDPGIDDRFGYYTCAKCHLSRSASEWMKMGFTL